MVAGNIPLVGDCDGNLLPLLKQYGFEWTQYSVFVDSLGITALLILYGMRGLRTNHRPATNLEDSAA